jgi:hypothetical protein
MELVIICRNNDRIRINDETYNAEEFETKMADPNRLGVRIGDMWFSRIDIVRVMPANIYEQIENQ